MAIVLARRYLLTALNAAKVPRYPVRFAQTRFVSSVTGDSKTLELAENFWEQVEVQETPDSAANTVTLAGKSLKTPTGKDILIPKTKPSFLADLIAQEWSSMATLSLKNYHIPLTSMAARSIDLTPEERAAVTQKLLPYLDTDTLLVLAPAKDCEGALRTDQLQKYPPVTQDACKVWGIPALRVLDTEESLFGSAQPKEVKDRVVSWMDSLDNWQFASLERATTAARSLIVGMNIVLHRRTVDELADLANLDVIHQTRVWGQVEDTHDVDHADIRRVLGAAYINAL